MSLKEQRLNQLEARVMALESERDRVRKHIERMKEMPSRVEASVEDSLARMRDQVTALRSAIDSLERFQRNERALPPAEQRIGLAGVGAEALEAHERKQAQQEQAAADAELDWDGTDGTQGQLADAEESELSKETKRGRGKNQL